MTTTGLESKIQKTEVVMTRIEDDLLTLMQAAGLNEINLPGQGRIVRDGQKLTVEPPIYPKTGERGNGLH